MNPSSAGHTFQPTIVLSEIGVYCADHKQENMIYVKSECGVHEDRPFSSDSL